MNQFIISEQEKNRILKMHQNATSRQYLMEEDFRNNITMTFSLPTKKNEKTGKYEYVKTGGVKYTATGTASKDGKNSIDGYTKINSLFINGSSVKMASSLKKPGSIVGEFRVDEKTFDFLVGKVNTTTPIDNISTVTLAKANGGSETNYIAFSVKTYDLNVPTQK